MPCGSLRTRSRLLGFSLLAATLITGCGTYLVDEFRGLVVEDLSAALTNSGATEDEPCVRRVNRCGPSGLPALLIPDCPLGVVCFITACNDHDICYQTCGSSKRVCDNLFYQGMMSICSERLVGGEQEPVRCFVLAYVYWQAVLRYGHESFDITQSRVCECAEGGNASPIRARRVVADPPVSPPFDDRDNDLMPDDWEISVGLDPYDPGDAMQDFDSDGLLNLREFIDGTDPFDSDANVQKVEERAAGYGPRAAAKNP